MGATANADGALTESNGNNNQTTTPFTVNGTQGQIYNTAFLTDAQLTASSTLTATQIRSFLASQGSYFATTVNDVDGVSFDLATTISQAASQYQINPEVLLTTLQKESVGVTTSTRPSDARMSLLMGAGSPSTARAQVATAAQFFRSYQDALASGGATVSGWRTGVAKTTVDGVTVTPATNAVAGQFTYTPYAGVQWGGNQSSVGGAYLFYYWWNQFGFSSQTTTPVLNVSTTSLTLPTTTQGTAGATTSFTVSGSGLGSGDTLNLMAPAGSEISQSSTSGFVNTFLLYPNSSGSLATTTIYVRTSASATANVSGNLTITDALHGSLNKSIPVSGTVTPVTGPVNNNFANRTPISGALATMTGSNVGATKESGEPNPVGNSGGKSVWWTWTAPSSGSVQIDTIGSSFDTILGVYTGSSVSTLTMVANDDDGGGNYTSKVTFTAVSGTTYQILVDGYNGASGNITLHVSLTSVATPVLNVSTTSLTLPATTQGTAGTTTSFTVSGSGLSANASITVLAPSGCEISLSGSSGFANMLPLSANSGGTLSSTQIYTRISASAATNISGVISLNDSVDNCSKLLPVSGTVTPVTGLVNNNFANRTPISGTSATMTGTNVGATKESGEPNHFGNSGGKSVWWTWTASSSGSVQIDTIGSSFDTIMGVYTGSSVSALTTVASDDDNGGNYTSKVTFNAVAGTVYQIAVDGYNYGYGAASGNITLHVSLTTTTYDGTTPAPGTTGTNRAVPTTPPVQSDASNRSVALYNNVINQFAVGVNPRYQPSANATYCNIFSWDVTRAMNAEIPHWVDASVYQQLTGSAPANNATQGELTANLTALWLRNYGAANGWRSVSADAAQSSANLGRPTVVCWYNSGSVGHIAVVRPGSITQNGPTIAQAGLQNFNLGHVYDSFPQAASLEYWTHD